MTIGESRSAVAGSITSWSNMVYQNLTPRIRHFPMLTALRRSITSPCPTTYTAHRTYYQPRRGTCFRTWPIEHNITPHVESPSKHLPLYKRTPHTRTVPPRTITSTRLRCSMPTHLFLQATAPTQDQLHQHSSRRTRLRSQQFQHY